MMWIVNWASYIDWECMHDDGGYDSISAQAHPNGVVLRDLGEDRLQHLFEMITNEWMFTEQIDEGDDDRPKLKWVANEQLVGSFKQWDVFAPNGDLYGVVIAREVEVQ